MTEPEPDLLAPLREVPKPPKPKSDPRDEQFEAAGQELFGVVKEWMQKHNLKAIPAFYLITTLLQGHMRAVILQQRELEG